MCQLASSEIWIATWDVLHCRDYCTRKPKDWGGRTLQKPFLERYFELVGIFKRHNKLDPCIDLFC
jgi:hypothetical protein